MNIKQVIVTIIFVLLLGGVAAYYVKNNLKKTDIPSDVASGTQKASAAQPANPPAQFMAVSKYMVQNLGSISPVKAASGTLLTMSRMQVSNATGTVEYGDGKKKYTADFSYVVDPTTNTVSVSNFTLRK